MHIPYNTKQLQYAKLQRKSQPHKSLTAKTVTLHKPNVRFVGGRADFGPKFEVGEVGFVELVVLTMEISCTTL